MTKKKADSIDDQAPDAAEFDSWSESDDDHAIEELIAGRFKVRHIIKDDRYWCLVNGHRYTLPLLLSIDDYAALSGASDDGQSIAAFKGMLARFGGRRQAELLSGEPVQSVTAMLDDYAGVILKTQGVGLGKSSNTRD